MTRSEGAATYTDDRYGFVAGLDLLDAAGQPSTDPTTATAALLRGHDGRRWTFDLFTDAGGARQGRLTSMLDANGRGQTLTYVVAVQPQDNWKIATISDDQGHVASVSYAPNLLANQHPVISRIDINDGTFVIYNAQPLLPTGIASTLTVTLANGDQSVITATEAADTSLTVVFQDAAAEGVHRNKTVKLLARTAIDPRFFTTLPYCIQQVTDGAGVIGYRRRLEAITPANTSGFSTTWGILVDEGNNRILRLTTSWDGHIAKTEYATAANWSQPTSTYTWQTTRSYTTDAQYRVGEYVDAQAATTRLTYKPGTTHILTEQTPAGTTTYTRNALGQELSRVDPAGVRSESTYDVKGNRLTYSVAVGTASAATRSWTYNTRGQPLTETDPLGRTTSYVYDATGRMLSVTEPADVASGVRAVTNYAYDSAGRLSAMVSPMGVRTTYGYDLRNRLVTTTYADTSTETVTYGTGLYANLVTVTKDRNGRLTTNAYDLAGRLTRVTQSSGPGDLPTAQVQVREELTYVAGTNLVAKRIRDGEATVYGYDQRGRLKSSTVYTNGTVGLTSTQAYDVEGRVTLATDPYGRRTWYVYDAVGNQTRTVRELVVGGLTGTVNPSSLVRQTGLNPAYVIEDATYDAIGRRILMTDGLGVVTKLTYTLRGQTASVIVGFGRTKSLTTTYGYDLADQRIAVTSPGLVRTEYAYTGRGLLRQIIEAAGTAEATIVRQVVYNLARKPTQETDALGRTTIYAYGGCCSRLLSITDAGGFVTSFTYDAVGNRLSVTDPLLNVTTTAYDLRNRVTNITNPLAKTSQFTFDESLTDNVGIQKDALVTGLIAGLGMGTNANGQMVKRIDENGKPWYEAFDGLGRSILRVDPLGNTTRTAYDSVVSGLVETVASDGLNKTTRARADGAGQSRTMIDALNFATTQAYDAQGNARQVRSADGIGQDMVYDAFRRLETVSETRTTGLAVVTRSYDADGWLISDANAALKVETSAYDRRGRRTQLIDRLGKPTRFTYDAVGNLLRIVDADALATITATPGMTQAQQDALATQYVYNALNLLTHETFPTGAAGRTRRVYTYDASRRLATRTVGVADPASATGFLAGKAVETTTYTYDKANRLTTRAYSDGTSDTFTYDSAGVLLTATSSKYGNKITNTYDAARRRLTETLTVTAGVAQSATTLVDGVYVTKSTYDKANRETQVTYPDNQVAIRTLDDRGLLTGVSFGGSAVTTRTYSNDGRLLTSTSGNGLVEQRTYISGSPLVATISVPGVTSFTYGYDAVGRKTAETNNLAGTDSQSFVYDDASRLTSWKKGPVATPVSSQSWTLSTVGDWKQTVRDGVTETRSHAAVHEISQIGSAILGYDIKGNLTTDQPKSGQLAQAYAWDLENRLVRASNLADTAWGSAVYAYDALGRRVSKTIDGRTTTYVSHGAQVVYAFDAQAVSAKTASTQDATLANLALTPRGLAGTSGAFLPGAVRTSSKAGVVRVNFQPISSPDAPGYLADRGRTYAPRTSNAMTYGWNVDRTTVTRQRNRVELPQWDTLVEMGTATWEIALPNGIYPVVVVAGDPAFVNQTNNLLIEGQVRNDPDPGSSTVGYAQGDFDAWALLANVTDGKLTISAGVGAVNPKLCFVEIGLVGTALPSDIDTRLTASVNAMNTQTAGSAFPPIVATPRYFVYGSYVDEVVCYISGSGAQTQRYFPHYNHLYSVAALTHGTTRAVVERYTYDAYGKQRVTDASRAVTRARSSVGWDRGFTGYIADNETGLLHARARQYSPTLGRFARRDPLGYVDGLSLYMSYFIPNGVDPDGQKCCCIDHPELCSIEISADGQGEANMSHNPGKQIEWSASFRTPKVKVELKFSGTCCSIDECHLAQDTKWELNYEKPSSGGTKGDYGSANGDGNSYTDQPGIDVYYGPGAEQKAPPAGYGWIRWGAHVYVEEAPSVEANWGYVAYFKWDANNNSDGGIIWSNSGVPQLPAKATIK